MIKNLALFSYTGEGLPIAKKFQNEGGKVLVGIIEDHKDTLTKIEDDKPEGKEEKKRRLETYDGVLEKMPAQKLVDLLKNEGNKKEWFIYPDLNHCFKFTSQLEGMGFNGIFPSEEDRIMEVDRDLAKKFVQENYPMIEESQSFEFKTIDEGERFLEENEEIYVLKGKDENAPTVLPQSEDPELAREEIIAILEKHQKEYETSGYILEVKISDAIEHTPQAVFKDGELIYTLDDLECKRKYAGDVGEMTGCALDLLFWTEEGNDINEIAFPQKVYEMAKKHEGVFFWDASLYISQRTSKVYFGEFCSNRPGYNCLYSELTNLDSVMGYFNDLSQGVNPFDKKQKAFTGSIRIFSSEYEPADDTYLSKADIEFIYKGDDKYFWPMDLKLADKKMLTTGYLEDLAVITGQGDTITELAENLYNNLRQFTFTGRRWSYRYRGDYTAVDYPTSGQILLFGFPVLFLFPRLL